MEMPIVLAIVAEALFVLRHFAMRRVAARQGRFVWLMFLPTLLGGVVILWASIPVFENAPLVAALMAISGLGYLALVLRFITRLSRNVTATGPGDDITEAFIEPMVDYATTTMGILLIGALVAMVGLIIWGVSQAAR